MAKILEALAYDNLRVEADINKRSPEHTRIHRKIDEYQDKLYAILDEEGKRIFDEYLELEAQASSYYAVERFVYGFRLGLTIAAESLMKPEEFINGRKGYDTDPSSVADKHIQICRSKCKKKSLPITYFMNRIGFNRRSFKRSKLSR